MILYIKIQGMACLNSYNQQESQNRLMIEAQTLGFISDSITITHYLTGFAHTGGANRLYINQGDLTLLEEADKYSYGVQDEGCALATVFSDPDND